MTTKKHSHKKVDQGTGSSAASSTNPAPALHRPGGMVVQKREDEDAANIASQDPFKIRVYHGQSLFNLSLPSASSTFGDVKRLISRETGLDPSEQRLFYRGIEKEDNVCLSDAGVKNSSKLLLREVEASKEKKLEQSKKKEDIAKACEAITLVSEEVGKLSDKVAALEGSVRSGSKVPEKEILLMEELLMRQLLKLDGIVAEEKAKELRKLEVRHIQSLEKKLEEIKERNANPHSTNKKVEPNKVAVTTQWETFDSGVGSLNPPASAPSAADPSKDWEQFD